MRRLHFLILATLVIAFIYGCSGGGGENPVIPVDVPKVAESSSNLHLLGFWNVVVDTNAGTIEAIDMRSSDLIINVLGFMEPPPLVSLNIDFGTLIIDDINNQILVDVIFSHPIPDAVFMGFDCRGIVFGPDVLNADGYTIVCSPEFFDGVPFGYMDGLLGAPHSIAGYSGLAGYKYFCDGLGKDDVLSDFFDIEANLDDRGVFSEAPQKNTRHYDLDWTDSSQAFFVFNYAVYANYDWPIGDPVDDVDDFSITTANSAEAFCCSVYELANSLWYSSGTGGGNISLQVEVWDWQGDITDVTVESWDGTVIPQTSYDVIAGAGTSKSTIYEFYAMAGNPTSSGDLDLMITATDPVTFGAAWFFSLLDPSHSLYDDQLYNVFKYTTTVIECPIPTVTGTYLGAGIIDDKSIYCTNLIDGTSLAVKLTDGTTDYDGTDVTFKSGTELTADFDLTGATFGELLDIVITNGCGTEGSADDAWEVYYWIYPITPYNIDTMTGFGSPNDITCHPSQDQVMIAYSTSNVRWTIDYGTSNSYPLPGGRISKYIDSSSWGVFAAETSSGCSSTEYPVWGWQNWSGSWYSSHYWFGMCSWVSKDMAGAGNPSTATVWDCVDMNGYYYFIGANAWSQMNYFYAAFGPMYNGSGTNGVIPANFLAAEGAPSSSFDLYILEDLPTTTTAVVEKWRISPVSYQSWSAGEDLLTDAIDVTTWADGTCFVLEEDGDGDPNIWAFSVTDGSMIGKSGKIDNSVMSGDALRMDAYRYSDPDELHVLHADGVTKFSM